MNKIFNLIWGQVRGLLVGFDSVVYGFIPILYKTMLYLANIDLVSENVPIQALIQRIYILVGVFMLFKLSFSIMNYIVNPDAFSDQSRGFTNLVRRVLTAIVLLVSIPWIFQEAYVVQGKIITSGILPRLILGETVSYENSEGNDYLEQIIDTSATDVQFLLFGPFYSLNYKSSDFTDCTPDKNNPSKYILGTSGMASSKECLEAVAKSMDEDDTVIASGVDLTNFFRYGEDATDERDFSKFSGLAAWTDSSGEFAINYYPIISTLCGGYLVFLLLSFCIDVAARIIRLLFLQILSPVAVISSIDPTSSGDRLKDWAKECFKTWFSLFLRLLVIFLIIQLVRVVTNTIYGGNNGFTVEGFGNSQGFGFFVWINVLLIIGIFTAAGKIPELIEKATGIQMSGELQLNPFKNSFISKATNLGVGAAMGAVGGALSGSFAAYNTARANDYGFVRSIGSGIGALGTGGVTGFARGGRAGGLKGWNSGLQSGGRIARRMDVRAATGGIKGFPGMVADRARDFIGAPTSYESRENRAKRFDSVSSSIDQMDQRIVDQLSKKNNVWKGIQADRAKYEQMYKNGESIDSQTVSDRMGQLDNDVLNAASEYNNASSLLDNLRKSGVSSSSEEYKRQEDIVKATKASFEEAKARYEHMEDVYTAPGPMSQEAYVDLLNNAYQQEQELKANYYDSNVVVDSNGQTTYKDEQLELYRRAAEKASKDAGFGKQLPDSWYDIGGAGNSNSLKSRAEHSAVEIRSSKSYNDQRDRDQAIHSTRLDSHQKR